MVIHGYAFWAFVTRLGEAQILLPAALAALFWLARRADGRLLAAWWLALLSVAVALTTASKVAFIGFGLGIPVLNFTGISGHAMFAAAVYPLLLGTLTPPVASRARWLALAVGAGLALLVGVSRAVIGVHSGSEVIAGLAVGGAVSGIALGLAQLPHTKIGLAIPVGLALWLALTPMHAPASRTHDWVTQLSLKVSGRATPYTRPQMLREWRARKAMPVSAAPCADPSCAPTTARRPAT